MKICVRLPDPLLRRALVDLLNTHGHEATALPGCGGMHDLQITTLDPATAVCSARAVLSLERGIDRIPDPDPRAALERALEEGGEAIWRAPVDTKLLLDVLGPANAPPPCPDPARVESVGDLADAPHPWLLLDAQSGGIEAMNLLAEQHFGREPGAPAPDLDDLPLAPELREALRVESEGVRFDEVEGRGQVTVWWTHRSGRRMVCLLEALPSQSASVRHRQSLAELGTMAATLAHEIRNPVASLAGALDLLESETDPDDRAEVLDMARARVRQLSRLLDKTLTLSRPITDVAESVEVRPAIESALNNLSLDPAFANVQIDYDMPDEPVPVQGFQGALVQALTNLLLNAAQAQGGEGTIHLSLERTPRQAILRIQDEGPGIPRKRRGDVFKPFYTTRASGTGLGLAEVRRAVNAMGGRVSVEDSDTGACFRLELPLART